MSKGVLLFAFNNGSTNYFEMAIATAKRVNHFLKLPVSVITDEESCVNYKNYDYKFDNLIIATAQSGNMKDKKVWNNKGRYRAYDLTPYDETLLLDTDYLVNSNKLLTVFDIYDDFMCHDRTSFFHNPESNQEEISKLSFNTLWATVIFFKKTPKVKQIFECLQMVQENYQHYVHIYNFIGGMFRNDYALTIALWIVNGQTINKKHYIPWPLVHAATDVTVYRSTDNPFNTEYIVMERAERRPAYFLVKDVDFHLISKDNFMELVDV